MEVFDLTSPFIRTYQSALIRIVTIPNTVELLYLNWPIRKQYDTYHTDILSRS